jgi:hypothetical protein
MFTSLYSFKQILFLINVDAEVNKIDDSVFFLGYVRSQVVHTRNMLQRNSPMGRIEKQSITYATVKKKDGFENTSVVKRRVIVCVSGVSVWRCKTPQECIPHNSCGSNILFGGEQGDWGFFYKQKQ